MRRNFAPTASNPFPVADLQFEIVKPEARLFLFSKDLPKKPTRAPAAASYDAMD